MMHYSARNTGKDAHAVDELRKALAAGVTAAMLVPNQDAKDRFLARHRDIPRSAVWVGNLDWSGDSSPVCEGPYYEFWDDPLYGAQEDHLCTRTDSQIRCANLDCPERRE